MWTTSISSEIHKTYYFITLSCYFWIYRHGLQIGAHVNSKTKYPRLRIHWKNIPGSGLDRQKVRTYVQSKMDQNQLWLCENSEKLVVVAELCSLECKFTGGSREAYPIFPEPWRHNIVRASMQWPTRILQRFVNWCGTKVL